MAKSNDLHQLIHSLSASEKRHFFIFSGRHVINGQNNYLRIFEAIQKQEVYDEDELMVHFRGEKFIRQFSFAKNYLYNQILRSLRAFHFERSPEMEFRSGLDQIEILMERQLYDQALKKLRSLKKKALKFEHFSVLIDIVARERTLAKRVGGKYLFTRMPELIKEEEKYHLYLQNERTLSNHYDQAFILTQQKLGLTSKELESSVNLILKDEVLKKEVNALTYTGKLAWNLIHAFIAQLKGEALEAQAYFKRNLEHYQTAPHQAQAYPKKYALTLVDYLNACHQTQNYTEFISVVEKIRSISGLPTDAKAKLYWITCNLELIYYLNTGKLQEGKALIPSWEKKLNEYEFAVDEISWVSYTYNIFLLHYFLEEHKACSQNLNRILNRSKTPVRRDLFRFCKVMYLIILHEREDWDLLESMVDVTRRYLKSQEPLNPLELLCLGVLKSRLKMGMGQNSAYFQEVLDNFQAQRGDMIRLFGGQEIEYWLQSKAEGKPIVGVIPN